MGSIHYFDMDIYVMFDMKIENAPMKEYRDYLGAKNIIFTNRKIKKLAIHLPPEGGSFLARCLIKFFS